MQENFLHMSTSAGKFPTHKCKMLHKNFPAHTVKICQVQETCFLHFNFQIQVHLATDFHFFFLSEHVCYVSKIGRSSVQVNFEALL